MAIEITLYSGDSVGHVSLGVDYVLREISPKHESHVRQVLAAIEGLSVHGGKLISTAISERTIASSSRLVLCHPRIPFISYSHEWPMEMMRDAGLLQLNLLAELLKRELTLKDCGVPANVVFDSTTPIFVDVASIIKREFLTEQNFLNTASQRLVELDLASNCFHAMFEILFVPYFLHPLYLFEQGRFKGTRKRMLETTLNAYPQPIAFNEVFADPADSIKERYQEHRSARMDSLLNKDWQSYVSLYQDEVAGLCLEEARSDYLDYYKIKGEDFSFDNSSDWLPKQQIVADVLSKQQPQSVLDIGANTGWFSILAAREGAQVVALDVDEACMNRLYKHAKTEGLSIQPLVIDFLQLTPDLFPHAGVLAEGELGLDPLMLAFERRVKVDLVLALGITHHLILGHGRTVSDVISQLSGLSKHSLIMEYLPRNDPLIEQQRDFFPAYEKDPQEFSWYTLDVFLEEFGKHFDRVEVRPSNQGRSLLHAEGKKQTSILAQT